MHAQWTTFCGRITSQREHLWFRGDRKSVEQLRFLDYRVSESSFFIAAFVCARVQRDILSREMRKKRCEQGRRRARSKNGKEIKESLVSRKLPV